MDKLNSLFDKSKEPKDINLQFNKSYGKGDCDYDKLVINLSHFSMEDTLKEHLYMINKGIEESKLIIFDYINRNMDHLERVVEPMQILFSHGQWYLIGFCRSKNDYRKFKLVRMSKLRFDETFTRKNISEDELKERFIDSYNEKSIKVSLVFNNKIGAQLPEYFIKDSINKSEDGRFIVEEVYPYEKGLIKFILSFGEECEVIGPEYLRKEIKDYLKTLLEKYDD